MPARWLLPLLALACISATAGERWKLQYFYDQEDRDLVINDIRFLSPKRAIAVGFLREKGKPKPAGLITSDGGETWKPVELPTAGFSVFSLKDQVVWLVGEKGIWKSSESGNSWIKVSGQQDLLRVYFRDEQHGWAVGTNKGFFETLDGGKEWTKVPAGDEPKTTPEYTVYHWIEFADGNRGLVCGSSRPPRKGERTPDWMDPERAMRRREWPSTVILIQTMNGGRKWISNAISMFGSMTRVRTASDGRGLALVQFFNSFDYPSEIYEMNWRTGDIRRVFREKNRSVTDVALIPNGLAYLAAVEPPGLAPVPGIPGKVKILRSLDLKDWEEMEVDYRAEASRVVLASDGSGGLWAATDTGMILKLTKD
jgi:hypothetical protein